MFNGMSWGYNVLHYITLVQCPSPFGCRFSLGSALSLRHWYTSCIPTKTCSPNKCKNWSWARYRAKSACKSVCVCCRQKHHLRDLKSYTKQYCAHIKQQWTEGQPLPVQSIHERYNAINCMCCLRLLETPRQAGHASTSTSLDMASKAKAYTADACLKSFVSSCWYFCVCAFWLKQFRRHWPLSLFQQLQKLCCACYRAQSACMCVCAADASPPKSQWKEYI